jgi:RES domain-containing protein
VRACAQCFVFTTWIANASPPESSAGTCDFGHGYASQTWPTSAWIDSLTQLIQLYEVASDGTGGFPLSRHIQQDWRIFSFSDPERVAQFLGSAMGESHELLSEGVLVRLRAVAEDDGSDALSSWAQFSEEIKTRNRYFPQAVPDRRVLERILQEHVRPVHKDVKLFRARLTESEALDASEMGAPPANKTAAGRANPVGIPYLYLSFSEETCIYEARAGNHSRLTIGTFHPRRDLSVLNLADIVPPDFFSVEDVGAVEEQVRRISLHRYLVALGDELKKPIRVTDQPIDYIPTQYLCELAKSLGLDGVLYSSSQHSNGRNLVVFDIDAAVCDTAVELVELTAVEATWRVLTPS